jgi:membrane-associated phospholipid phosphatase
MKEKQQKQANHVSLKIFLGMLSFIVAVYIFGAVSHRIFSHNGNKLDELIFKALSAHTSEGLVWWMQFFSFFGKPYFLIPAYLILVGWYFFLGQKRLALEIATVAVTSTAFSFALKFLFQRDRPSIQVLDYLGGYSFPSGHAFLCFIFCSMLTYLVWMTSIEKRYKIMAAIGLFLFALAIGSSRIVLRVHYASDVIAGFALGYAWVLLFFWIQRKRF